MSINLTYSCDILPLPQNPVQPPAMLAMALPMLPPTLSFVITNGLSYLRMFGSLLDDLAGLLVGVGLLTVLASWISGLQ